jgi:putative peptidoglycan lipid II flippase
VGSETVPQPYATARSAVGLTALGLLSPITGLAVEMAIALEFGTSATADAYRVALSIVYIGQQFFMGMIFPNIVVPLFAEYRARGQEAEAWNATISLTVLILIPTTLLTAVMFAWPAPIASLLAPGLAALARERTIFFIRWFALGLIPALLTGAALALLYSYRIFWTSPAGQIASNVAIAGVLLSLTRLFGSATLAIGTLAGLACLLIVQLPGLLPAIRRVKEDLRLRVDPRHPGVRKGIGLSAPLTWSTLTGHFSTILINWSLSEAPVGTIAALGYAGKAQRLASTLPGVLATVLFPKFADLSASTSREQLRALCTRAVRMALFMSVPLGCALVVLREPVIAVLFEHGAFSSAATVKVARLFALLTLLMPAAVASTYFVKVLYALQEMWWPAYDHAICLVLQLIAIPLAARHFGAEGVALAMVGVWWFGTGFHVAVLHWKYRAINVGELTGFLVKTTLYGAFAAYFGSAVVSILFRTAAPAGSALAVLELAWSASFSLGLFYLATAMAGWPESLECTRYVRWQGAPLLSVIRHAVLG